MGVTFTNHLEALSVSKVVSTIHFGESTPKCEHDLCLAALEIGFHLIFFASIQQQAHSHLCLRNKGLVAGGSQQDVQVIHPRGAE